MTAGSILSSVVGAPVSGGGAAVADGTPVSRLATSTSSARSAVEPRAADIGILLDITWIWLPGSCARGGEGRPVAKGVGTVRPPQTSRAPWHPVGGGSMDPGWRAPGRWRETDTSPDGTEGRAPDAGADRTDRGAGVGVRRAG